MRPTEREAVLRLRSKEPTPLDRLIARVQHEMLQKGPDSEDYPTLMTYLERLNEVKAKKTPSPISRDTIVTVLGNLTGIVLIVAYEQKHVITSKAFPHIIRPK